MTKPLMRVEGLQAFQRDLLTMGKEVNRAVDRDVRAAAKPIVRRGRKTYRQLHPPSSRSNKKSHLGLRTGVRGARVSVRLGSTGRPYLLGQEFGSSRFPQFPPYRRHPSGRGGVGRFFWPAILAEARSLRRKILTVIDQAVDRHFED